MPPEDGDKGNLKEGFTPTSLGFVYCEDESLIKVNSWQKINDAWYYFYSSGAMAVNTTIDGYYVDNNGTWIR